MTIGEARKRYMNIDVVCPYLNKKMRPEFKIQKRENCPRKDGIIWNYM